MNSRPNKIKYIPNNNKNRIASSTSPSYKYLTTNTNKDNKNQKFNNSLNKSHEKCHSNQQFNNISNFQTYINFSKKKKFFNSKLYFI